VHERNQSSSWFKKEEEESGAQNDKTEDVVRSRVHKNLAHSLTGKQKKKKPNKFPFSQESFVTTSCFVPSLPLNPSTEIQTNTNNGGASNNGGPKRTS
jgi:hypothetical protein